ncbi:MAG: universal stress protein [Acidobacteriota bacterium]|nr:universal stress protein [Acidobacteriota bacterium]
MPRFTKILLPTDFSECSDQALDYGALLAEQFDAELHLLHALILMHDDPADPERRFPEETALLDRLEQVTNTQLGAIAGRENVAELRVREIRRRGFRASLVILDYAREAGADLIVMGTHGRRGPMRWFLGSVAEEVLRHATCPVLAVREREGGQPLHRIRTVLVPIDFSAASVESVRLAAELAGLYEAGLTLLHVVNVPTVPSMYGQVFPVDTAPIAERAAGELRELARRAGLGDEDAEVVVADGWPAHAIVDHARRARCGLIVMPPRTSRERGLLGGTTDLVLRRTPCPVLTVPPARPAPE